jgi:hypothetical protein
MTNVNQLKQYMTKKGEYDRLQARLKVINIELGNWDKVKAASITDMPTHHDTENGDKVGDIVGDRETKELERDRIEYELAKLSEYIIEVDCKLDCLQDNYRFILEQTYKHNKRFQRILKEYNDIFSLVVYDTLVKIKTKAHRELNKLK